MTEQMLCEQRDILRMLKKLEEGMAENQHKKIKGYRDLSEEEIALMNEVKEMEAEVGRLVKKLSARVMPAEGLDPRWILIGRTDLQTGFMALVRAIARPATEL